MIGPARFVDRGYTPPTPSPLRQYRVLQLASDAQGNALGTIDFRRTGTFSSNVAIAGPATANDYFNPGFSNRAIFDNCVTSDQGTASLPLLQTRYVTYKVAGVTYADGSTWP